MTWIESLYHLLHSTHAYYALRNPSRLPYTSQTVCNSPAWIDSSSPENSLIFLLWVSPLLPNLKCLHDTMGYLHDGGHRLEYVHWHVQLWSGYRTNNLLKGRHYSTLVQPLPTLGWSTQTQIPISIHPTQVQIHHYFKLGYELHGQTEYMYNLIGGSLSDLQPENWYGKFNWRPMNEFEPLPSHGCKAT